MGFDITRRKLLRDGTLLIGAGASMSSFLSASARPASAQGSARPTKTLRVGTNIPFTTLDPNTINTSVFPFRNSVFDPLMNIPVVDIPTYKLGDIQSELASSYSVNKDYTEIRLRIRDGVKFHDGSPMTVEDVVTSVRRALDPITGGTLSGSLAAITSASSEGNEVVLRTSAPNLGALYRLSLFRVQSPRHFSTVTNRPVGTGPFKFVEWVPGDHLTLERFDDYWRPIPSNIKTLNFKFYTDPEAMLNAAIAGDLDILQFGQLKDASA